jgi:hypothetical protein
MMFMEYVKHTFQLRAEAVLHIINFIFRWGMKVETNDMTPAAS